MRKRRFRGRTLVVRHGLINILLYAVGTLAAACLAARTGAVPAHLQAAAVGECISVFKAVSLNEEEIYFSELNPYGIISKTVPSVSANEEMRKKYAAMFKGSIKAKREQKQPEKPAEEVKSLPGTVREVNSAGGMSFINATDYAVDASAMQSEGFHMDADGASPKILIISTHSSEAYSDSEGARSEDDNYNVARVAEEITKTLKNAGVGVIHDRTKNDSPSYNGSYKKALGVIEKNLQSYPGIEAVIDVHRDYMETSDKVMLKPTAEFADVGKAAQLMFVIGTDAMGLEHPNWRENLRFAVKLQEILNSSRPGLCRSINLRTERFNQHMTRGSMIVEVGSSANTLDEAVKSGKMLGEALAAALKP